MVKREGSWVSYGYHSDAIAIIVSKLVSSKERSSDLTILTIMCNNPASTHSLL